MAPCMTLATAFFREYLGTRRLICLSTKQIIKHELADLSNRFERQSFYYKTVERFGQNAQPLTELFAIRARVIPIAACPVSNPNSKIT